MQITKGLIIADPWIGYILDGSKTWEMRSSSTSHRGWFGLIRKGSGCIHGVARLVDVGSPLSPAEMLSTFEKHRIAADLIASGEVAKWNTPWIVTDVRRLPKPVRYVHRSGAVTWVALDTEAGQAIAAQMADLGPKDAVTPSVPPARSRGATLPPVTARSTRPVSAIRIEIREANLRHNHFYLRDHVHKFPDDVIGGSNRAKAAAREVILDWGGPEPARTDIDGEDKKFFRARGWIGAFYKLNDAQPGDFIVIEPVEPYRYRVSLAKST